MCSHRLREVVNQINTGTILVPQAEEMDERRTYPANRYAVDEVDVSTATSIVSAFHAARRRKMKSEVRRRSNQPSRKVKSMVCEGLCGFEIKFPVLSN